MSRPVAPDRAPAWVVAVSCGLVWWCIGFLPWILRCLFVKAGDDAAALEERSNGWMTAPFLMHGVVGLFAMAILGSVAAAIASAWLARSAGTTAVVAGVGGAVLLVTLHSGWAVSATDTIAADDRVTTALQVLTGVIAAAGMLFGLLAANFSGPVRASALALPAVLVPEWYAVLHDGTGVRTVLLGVALGVALGASVSKPWHVVGWLPAAAIAWLAQAGVWGVLAASSQVRPGSGLSQQLMRPIEVGWDVFTAGLTTPSAHLLRGWYLSVAVAVAVAVVRIRRQQAALACASLPSGG